jgi:hypothetical protein
LRRRPWRPARGPLCPAGRMLGTSPMNGTTRMTHVASRLKASPSRLGLGASALGGGEGMSLVARPERLRPCTRGEVATQAAVEAFGAVHVGDGNHKEFIDRRQDRRPRNKLTLVGQAPGFRSERHNDRGAPRAGTKAYPLASRSHCEGFRPVARVDAWPPFGRLRPAKVFRRCFRPELKPSPKWQWLPRRRGQAIVSLSPPWKASSACNARRRRQKIPIKLCPCR